MKNDIIITLGWIFTLLAGAFGLSLALTFLPLPISSATFVLVLICGWICGLRHQHAPAAAPNDILKRFRGGSRT